MGTITVSSLGKAYKRYPGRWSRAAEWLTPGRQRHELVWVLRDVSFQVGVGEAIGIIGMNGAGKSTLLKIITGTVQPTEGHVTLAGNVAALLELGMGFHPEFTGRQNVYMAAQLMGHTAEDVARKMAGIEAFAEIGDYIDKPVRVYSSGMQVRLAFGVATAWRPDVLIVDEALSVGDVYFQHKSFERIRQFRREGTTLLLVSHDKAAIQAICDRAILLAEGRVAMEGHPEEVMDFYNAMIADRGHQSIERHAGSDGAVRTVSGTGEVVIAECLLLDERGREVEVGEVGQPVTLRVVAECRQAVDSLVVGYLIKDRLGQDVFGTNTFHHKKVLENLREGERVTLEFAFPLNVGPGSYAISVALHGDETHVTRNYEWCDRLLLFSVINGARNTFVGTAWIEPEIRCHL